ncbi:zinc finger protein 569 [Anabrus simplex]|uniref:zinc finger protein 569 n=1 Tax=Anabrus simplex TaxID=316456 RepID=UPI0035A390BE
MDYTVVESYIESMWQMTDDICAKNNNQPKITSDSVLVNNQSFTTTEKKGFEENVVMSPIATNCVSSEVTEASFKVNDKNCEAEGSKCIDIAVQCSQDNSSIPHVFEGETPIKDEPIGGTDITHRAPMGWGTHPASMHFDSLRVVSEHLVERIKLEDSSVFREAFPNGYTYHEMFTSSTTPTSTTSSINTSPECNVTGILNSCALNPTPAVKLQGDVSEVQNGSLINQKNSFVSKTKNNLVRNMNSNFMCTTMFLMNESLQQQNNSHQQHTTNNLKKHDIFNIACEKGCNCETANSIFRSGNSLMFAAATSDKHVGAAKHFMTPCGPLQLTAQECGEFLLKKASVTSNLSGEAAAHLGQHQNINNSSTGQQKIVRNVAVDVNEGQLHNGVSKAIPSMGGHKYRVDKERPFSCPECGKSFLLKHHLVTHARVHTGERPHVCTECGKSFAHKHCLSTHLLLHSSDRPYKCMECKKSFTLKHHLVTHARVHSRDRPFICQECGRTFPQKRHLVTHAKFHSGERPYVCEECGESFSQKDHLVIHSRFHGGQQPYVCPDCGSTFARKFELVNHGRLHGRMPHACEVCGKEFLQKRTLLAHARLHTGDERPFVCQHCGETFTRKPELIEHSKIHTGDKPFICRECGNCFSSREGLALHYRLHAGDRNVVADLCGLASALQQPAAHFLCPPPQHQPTSLAVANNKHQQGTSMTTGTLGHGVPKPKPYACPDCGKCFTQKHGLAQHNKRHSGGGCEIRQHVCDKCGKAFFQKNHLALHQRQHVEHPNGGSGAPQHQAEHKFEVLLPQHMEHPNGGSSSTQQQQPRDPKAFEVLIPTPGE